MKTGTILFCLLMVLTINACRGQANKGAMEITIENQGTLEEGRIIWGNEVLPPLPDADLQVAWKSSHLFFRSFFSGDEWQPSEKELSALVDEHFSLVRSRQLVVHFILFDDPIPAEILTLLENRPGSIKPSFYQGKIQP